ncbi:MAG: hypothetical protein HY901_08145 [Deltaproteobacteria bacterium]|nr:hypothetical protein [Deltaproteobacteria bacterium]
MSDRRKTSGFTPPPHANAKTHARIMAKLERMTPDEVFQTAVRAGIYTADGRLTSHYSSNGNEGEE